MFKKLLVGVLAGLLTCGVAYAETGKGNHYGANDNPGNHYGWGQNELPSSNGFGGLDLDASADGGAIDIAGKHIPNGFAGGISGAFGSAEGHADGIIFNGTVEGDLQVMAGGVVNSHAYVIHDFSFDKFIGIGSESEAHAVTSGKLTVKVDPDGNGYIWCVIPTAGGMAEGGIRGVAFEGTLDVSGLGNSPLHQWKSDGMTGGVAGQAAMGGFDGVVFAISGPDYEEWVKKCHRWVKIDVDSKAGAGIGAEIYLDGGSFSESYRFIEWNDGNKTEGMGTNVGAWTLVQTTGFDYDFDKGDAYAYADLDYSSMGRCREQYAYKVVGGAASFTTQDAPGFGGATASAKGMYAGSGDLGSSFFGSAQGGTYTTVTTVYGLKGSINSAGASMSVTATNAVPEN